MISPPSPILPHKGGGSRPSFAARELSGGVLGTLMNTVVFTVVVVAVEIVLAIAIALLISQTSVWTSRVTRLLILLPYGVPPITNGLIWSFIYSFQFGFL